MSLPKPLTPTLILALLAAACTPIEEPPPVDPQRGTTGGAGGGAPAADAATTPNTAPPAADAGRPSPDAATATDAATTADTATTLDTAPTLATPDTAITPTTDAGTPMTGACVPGANRCDGKIPQTCNSEARWLTLTECTNACDPATGRCTDGCKQGEKRCGSDCMPEGATCKCPQLPSNCGAAANESCCLSLAVPGGNFIRGAFNNYPATVSSFSMDKFEVTVGRFRRFVDSGMGVAAKAPGEGAGAHPKIAGTGWRSAWNSLLASDTAALKAGLKCGHPWGGVTWTDTAGPNENRPITCVDWYSAFAFCIWEGGRLPTDTEHHYASKGGDEGRYYPWSSPAASMLIDNNRASFWVDDNLMCMGDGIAGCTTADLVNVGTKPQGNGRWGHAELAGNAYEWVFDGFPEDWPMPCVDCVTIEATQKYGRTTRSGSFSDKPPGNLTTGSRIYAPADYRSGSGFRCAALTQ